MADLTDPEFSYVPDLTDLELSYVLDLLRPFGVTHDDLEHGCQLDLSTAGAMLILDGYTPTMCKRYTPFIGDGADEHDSLDVSPFGLEPGTQRIHGRRSAPIVAPGPEITSSSDTP